MLVTGEQPFQFFDDVELLVLGLLPLHRIIDYLNSLVHLCVEDLQTQLLYLLDSFDHLRLQILNLGLHEFDVELLAVAALPRGQLISLLAVYPRKAVSRLRRI